MGIILLLIFATDLFYGLIPVLYVLLGSILTIIYRLVLTFAGAYQYRDLLLSLLSAAGAYAFFWFLRAITKGKGMGDGDVILAFMLGLLLSWPKVVPGIMAGFVIGALAGSCLILMGKKKLGSTLPFGPFMIAGTMAALIWGNSFLEMILK